MNQSISSNVKFVESLSDSELNELMNEFDCYAEAELPHCDYSFHEESFNSYLSFIYSKLELFKIFDQERKSITVNNETKRDLVEGPFLLN